MKIYKLTITPEEALTCSAHRMIGNQAPSLDYIPSTALRGAIAAALFRKGKGGRVAELFGGSSPRWCPAWPASDKKDKMIIPTPLSYLYAKGDDGFAGKLGVINVLRTERPVNQESYRKLFGAESPADVPDRLQWIGISPGWLKFENTPQNSFFNPETVTPKISSAMYHGADYLTGSAREGWLYSREALVEYQKFISFVVDENEVIRDENNTLNEILLGKRITAGNGLASLEWSVVDSLPLWAVYKPPGKEDEEKDTVALQIMSPAIIPAERGGYLTGLDKTSWTKILGVDVDVVNAQSDAEAIYGWITSWDLPRERYPAIAAGSCYLLKLNNGNKEIRANFHKALENITNKGLGIRTGEGFGWTAVAPPWLDMTHHKGGETAGIDFTPVNLPPDGDDIDRVMKRDLIRAAFAFAGENGASDKAAELATIAYRVSSAEEFTNYLTGLSTRSNPRTWDKVQDAWNAFKNANILSNNPKIRLQQIRYFIYWAKTFAAGDTAGMEVGSDD